MKETHDYSHRFRSVYLVAVGFEIFVPATQALTSACRVTIVVYLAYDPRTMTLARRSGNWCTYRAHDDYVSGLKLVGKVSNETMASGITRGTITHAQNIGAPSHSHDANP
jgi:hypothetical protein